MFFVFKLVFLVIVTFGVFECVYVLLLLIVLNRSCNSVIASTAE